MTEIDIEQLCEQIKAEIEWEYEQMRKEDAHEKERMICEST